MSEQHNSAGESGQNVSFRGKMTIPFDLDAIFTMSYDVNGLRKVLEFIFEHLGEMNETLKASSAASA